MTPKKATRKKQSVCKIFFQDTGIFRDEFVVSVGSTEEELKKFCKKTKLKEEFTKVIFENFKEVEPKEGSTYFLPSTNAVLLLSMYEYENHWDFWDTLVHELSHVVHFLSKKKGIEEEPEAKAYLHDYLFTEIRKKIQGRF